MKYQVGDIYITTNPEMNTPEAVANRFGGDWEQIQGKFLLMAGNGYIVGSTGGAATVTLSASNMPAHTHPFSATTTSNGKHNHTMGQRWSNGSGSGSGYTHHANRSITTIHTDSDGSHTHSISGTTGATGSTAAHNNMPPYLTVYGWKRVA